MKRPIVKIGDPVLTVVCDPVESFDSKLKSLIGDLFDTLYAAKGLGLAAPQIGIPLQVCVVDVEGEKAVLINPEVKHKTQKTWIAEEGCLSIPGLRVHLERPLGITVSYVDDKNQEQTGNYSGLIGRAICHEMDHLNGRLISDYVLESIRHV